MKRGTLTILHRPLTKRIRGYVPLQRCAWHLRSSGISRRVAGWLVLDVSGQPWCVGRSGTNYPGTQCHVSEKRIPRSEYKFKLHPQAVSRVDYILMNIFSTLRTYGQSVKLARVKSRSLQPHIWEIPGLSLGPEKSYVWLNNSWFPCKPPGKYR